MGASARGTRGIGRGGETADPLAAPASAAIWRSPEGRAGRACSDRGGSGAKTKRSIPSRRRAPRRLGCGRLSCGRGGSDRAARRGRARPDCGHGGGDRARRRNGRPSRGPRLPSGMAAPRGPRLGAPVRIAGMGRGIGRRGRRRNGRPPRLQTSQRLGCAPGSSGWARPFGSRTQEGPGSGRPVLGRALPGKRRQPSGAIPLDSFTFLKIRFMVQIISSYFNIMTRFSRVKSKAPRDRAGGEIFAEVSPRAGAAAPAQPPLPIPAAGPRSGPARPRAGGARPARAPSPPVLRSGPLSRPRSSRPPAPGPPCPSSPCPGSPRPRSPR